MTRRWVVEGGGERLDRALARVFPDLSRARLQALIEAGEVTVEGAPARASQKTVEGQAVEVRVPPLTPATAEAEDIPLAVLFEDAHLVVIDKSAGMVVHPGPGHSRGTLVNALLARGGLSGIGGVERPGIVHRLDAGTSGVLVVAKDDITHRGLAEQFAAHTVDRRYLAVVHKVPLHDAGTLRSTLGRDPDDRLRIASRDDGRLAVTHWKALARADRLALLECRLETGRTHQVRVHLSEAGHPIVGDTVYARRDCTPPAAVRAAVEALERPLLHARLLGFTHPVSGERLTFETQPPEDFRVFSALAQLQVPSKVGSSQPSHPATGT